MKLCVLAYTYSLVVATLDHGLVAAFAPRSLPWGKPLLQKSSSSPSSLGMTPFDDALKTKYDYIVVGMGYAGSIMTTRLAERAKDKKILAIEYGGPVQAATGGASRDNVQIQFTAEMFQKAAAGEKGDYNADDPLCMPDVPGNYNNVAFRPLTDNYQLPEFPSCFQGVGLGGNGAYNGALYQEPADWWWNNKKYDDIFVNPSKHDAGTTNSQVMKPYIERVQDELADCINSTPSSDGVHYNHGLYDLVKPYLVKQGFKEEVTFKGKPGYDLNKVNDRFFMVPAVNTKNAIRAGATQWLEKIIDDDGNVKAAFPNLDTLYYTDVDKAILEDTVATGVQVSTPSKAASGGLDKTTGLTPTKTGVISLNEGGKVIFCAGTLPTTRLLYKSGVGCEAVREKVMPTSTFPFPVNNEAVGVLIHEHVTTALGMKHIGEEKPQPDTVHFDPADFNSPQQIGHVKDYTLYRKGPFSQYGPVVASHFKANMDLIKKDLPGYYHELDPDLEVSTELFYNPFGMGPYPPASNPELNPYNGPGTFSIYVMLLSPYQRGLFRLDKEEVAVYVQTYLNKHFSEAAMPNDAERAALNIPENYADLGTKDIGVMTASVLEVLGITAEPIEEGAEREIEVTMGPGDGQTEFPSSADGNKPIKDLDPTSPTDVLGFVSTYDNQEYARFNVNGEFMPITRLQENHYCSGAPLARSKDVWGQELGDRKVMYGVDPDTLEVRGTSGLLVADASLFPETVYCHPIGAIMALAEWAADIVHPAPEEK